MIRLLRGSAIDETARENLLNQSLCGLIYRVASLNLTRFRIVTNVRGRIDKPGISWFVDISLRICFRSEISAYPSARNFLYQPLLS